MDRENVTDITWLSSAQARDLRLMSSVTELINEVYEEAEKGLWAQGTARTSPEEVESFTRAGEMAVARVEGELVGCVRIRRLDGHTGEFGMLAAAPERRGTGIGRALVTFAERESALRGLEAMQLELLVPRAWSHPSKVFLDEWYTRIGYRAGRTGAIEDFHPQLAPHLATACDFVVYRKALEAAAR